MGPAETIGAVAVSIGGDYSPLVAAFGQAQGIAQRAGSAVANAFNQGAGAATGLVDQFGRSISTAGSEVGKTSAETAALNAQITALTARVNALAAALAKAGGAGHSAVTEIQATSGALRVLEGSGGIRAAERFLTMIPGLGQFLQAAFPVVGFIALAEVFSRMAAKAYEVYQNWTMVGIATKFAKDAADDYAKSVEKIKDKLAQIEQARFSKIVGPVGGAANEGTALGEKANQKQNAADALKNELVKAQLELTTKNAAIQSAASSNHLGDTSQLSRLSKEAEAAKANVDGLRASIGQLENEARVFREQAATKGLDSLIGQKGESKQGNEADASLQIAQLHAADSTAKRNAESARAIIKQRADMERELARIQNEGISGSEARAIANADALVRIAQQEREQLVKVAEVERDVRIRIAGGIGGQASREKNSNERGAIGAKTSDEIAGIRNEFSTLERDQQDAVEKATTKATEARAVFARTFTEQALRDFDKIDDGARKLEEHLQEGMKRTGEALTRVFEVQDKSKGETDQLALQAQKLLLERQYGQEVFHTAQQQIAYLKQIADIEAKARTAKISGIQGAIGEIGDTDDPHQMLKRAELEAELAKLQAEANNAGIVAQTKILGLIQQQTLQYQIQHSLATAASAIPGAIGGGIAAGIFQHGKGTGIGEEIAKSLRGIGQQLFGQILTQLITKMAIQAAVQAGLITVTSANTAATTANATATGIHAGVMITHTAVMISHLAVMIANTVATLANTIATLIQAALSLFGFADGGSPPVGVPSIVGERGPEIFVPKGAGTIIPNHMIKGYADGAGLDQLPSASGASIANNSTTFSGDMHFHAHGIQNPTQHAQMAVREIPNVLKARGAGWSPYSK